jgi:signal transduction histidine kinase
VTIEFSQNGERMFNTARAITDAANNIIGVVVTTQTLSAADKAIQDNINNSLLLLSVVIGVIILLFLRHSKIIDYMDLYKRLKDVDQLKDDFISMASHELRTPLTVIRGYAEYIREAPDLSLGTKDYAVKIDVSAKSLDALVSDILDVSKIQQGRMSFKVEKFDPRDILKAVVTSFEIPAKEKGLELLLNTAEDSVNKTILVDSERLKQVLVNVIGNAIKYTPKGSVRVSEYVENGKLCIRVEDTGLGISAEEREHLFEKFYRIRTKETENIHGTGLGLWITSQMVKEMKGSITVESIKGVGSHFVISFPLIK